MTTVRSGGFRVLTSRRTLELLEWKRDGARAVGQVDRGKSWCWSDDGEANRVLPPSRSYMIPFDSPKLRIV